MRDEKSQRPRREAERPFEGLSNRQWISLESGDGYDDVLGGSGFDQLCSRERCVIQTQPLGRQRCPRTTKKGTSKDDTTPQGSRNPDTNFIQYIIGARRAPERPTYGPSPSPDRNCGGFLGLKLIMARPFSLLLSLLLSLSHLLALSLPLISTSLSLLYCSNNSSRAPSCQTRERFQPSLAAIPGTRELLTLTSRYT